MAERFFSSDDPTKPVTGIGQTRRQRAAPAPKQEFDAVEVGYVGPTPSMLKIAEDPKEAVGFWDNFNTALKLSAAGLTVRNEARVLGITDAGVLPDTTIKPREQQTTAEAVGAGFGSIAGMLPHGVLGGAAGSGVGALVGGGLGFAVGGPPGAVIGAKLGAGITGAAGAFALPELIRSSYMSAATKGEVRDAVDFMSRLPDVYEPTMHSAKLGALFGVAAPIARGAVLLRGGMAPGAAAKGAVLGPTGMGAAKAVGLSETEAATASALLATTKAKAAALTAEYLAFAAGPAAIDWRLPEMYEFTDAAILLGGIKAAHVGGSATLNKLRDTYVASGKLPLEVARDSRLDPVILLDMDGRTATERASEQRTFARAVELREATETPPEARTEAQRRLIEEGPIRLTEDTSPVLARAFTILGKPEADRSPREALFLERMRTDDPLVEHVVATPEERASIAKYLRTELDRLGLHDVALQLEDRINRGGDDALYLNRVIQLALDTPPDQRMGVINHEVIHALRDLGVFTDAEWASLMRSAEGWVKDPNLRGDGITTEMRYITDPAYTRERVLEEAIADAHRALSEGRITDHAGLLTRTWAKVRDFFESFRNALNGAGFRTSLDILRDVQSGEIGARDRMADYGFSPEAVAASRRTRPVQEIIGRTFEEMMERIPEAIRTVSKNPMRMLDGKEFSTADLTSAGPGFLMLKKLSAAKVNDALRRAMDESVTAAGLSAELASRIVVPDAFLMDRIFKHPGAVRYWYELSANGFTQKYFKLDKADTEKLIDVTAATSGGQTPPSQMRMTLAAMAQDAQGLPITVGVRDQASLTGALSPESLSTHKFGNFSGTMQLLAGLRTHKPLPTIDLQMAKLHGLKPEEVASNPVLYETLARFWIAVRDLQNSGLAKGAQPYESWQAQALAWVEQRGGGDPADYASVMPQIIAELRAAGIPVPRGKITMDTLMDPRTSEVMAESSKRFEETPIATLEVNTTLTPSGRMAADAFSRLDGRTEPWARNARAEYESIQRSAMRELGNRTSIPGTSKKAPSVLSKLIGAVVGRRNLDVSRIDTDSYGSFEGVVNPNMRVPLGGRAGADWVALTEAQRQGVLAILGADLNQAASASALFSRVDAANAQTFSVFIKRYDKIDIPAETLTRLDQALGHSLSYSRVANGWVIDVNPDFSTGSPVYADRAKIRSAVESVLGPDVAYNTLPRSTQVDYIDQPNYATSIRRVSDAISRGSNTGGRRRTWNTEERLGALTEARNTVRSIARSRDARFEAWRADTLEKLEKAEASEVKAITSSPAASRRLGLDAFLSGNRLTKTGEPWRESGEELRFYTGTSRDITAFRPQQAGAIFLSPDPQVANDFAQLSSERTQLNPVVYPVYARAERPFDFDNATHMAQLVDWLKANTTDGTVARTQAAPYLRGHYKTVDDLIAAARNGSWGAMEHPEVQRYIKANHDAFWTMEYGVKNIGLYDPTNIKSAIGNVGTYDPSTADIRYSRREPQPAFYSGLMRAAENLTLKSAPAQQWLATLKRMPGVKPDEIKWTGLEEFLAAKGTATREEVIDFVRQNGVRVEEVELGAREVQVSRGLRSALNNELPTDQTGWLEAQAGFEHMARQAARARDEARSQRYWSLAEEAGRLAEGLDETGSTAGATKFANWQLPGGRNYRELLLTLPARDTITREPSKAPQGWGDTAGGDIGFIERGNTGADFRAGHFDQPNVLAHVRFNERRDADGKRVLFIEEIQSDWAQKGKKEGFETAPGMQWEGTRNGVPMLFATSEEAARYAGANGSFTRLPTSSDVPPAPFVASQKFGVFKENVEMSFVKGQIADPGQGEPVRFKTEEEATAFAKKYSADVRDLGMQADTTAWVALAAKRMIRYAVENGFDRVAWTTGEQQAARYDLSKQVNAVTVVKTNDNRYAVGFVPVGGGSSFSGGVHTLEALPGVVGKDLAKKIEGQEQDSMTYTGLDLKVGGEGMKTFYDRIVPNVVNDVLKKLGGGRVGTTTIEVPPASAMYPDKTTLREQLTQPGFDITPQMKESALGGQPLFSRRTPPGTDELRPQLPEAYRPLLDEQLIKNAFPGGIDKVKLADLIKNPVGEIPDTKAPNYINFRYITGPDQLKSLYAAITEKFTREIEEARQSPTTWDTSFAQAKDLINSDGTINTQTMRQAVSSVVLMDASLAVMKSADNLIKIDSTENRSAHEANMLMLVAAYKHDQGVGADSARALNLRKAMGEAKSTAESILESRQFQAQGKSGLTLTDPVELAKMVKMLADKPPKKVAEAISKMHEATTLDKVLEYWKAALVSGPWTHVVNLAGTGMYALSRLVHNEVEAVIGAARGRSVGFGEGQRRSMMEPLYQAIGMFDGIKQGLVDAGKVLAGDAVSLQRSEARAAIGEGYIPGVNIGRVIRTPFRLLSAEDVFVGSMIRRSAYVSRAVRMAVEEGRSIESREIKETVDSLLDGTHPRAKEFAESVEAEVLRFTFQAPLGEAGVAGSLLLQRAKPLQFIVPFYRTPTNIAKELIRNSPFAPISKTWREDIKAGGARQDRAVAEALIGTSIFGFVLYNALYGDSNGEPWITGSGPVDPKKNATWRASGKQAYSVRIGDKWYNYQRLQPLGTLLGMAADIAQVWDQLQGDEPDKAVKLLGTAFSNAVTSQTFLQGITNLAGALDAPERKLSTFAERFVSSFVPGVLGQPAASMDPYIREVNSIIEAVQSRIPVAREQLAPKLDLFGAPIEAKERLLGLAPITVTEETADRVRQEATELSIATPTPPKKLHVGRGMGKFGEIELSPEQKQTYTEVSGEFAHRTLSVIVEQPGWDNTPKLIKRQVFKRVFDAAHKLGALAALPPEDRQYLIQDAAQKLQEAMTQ